MAETNQWEYRALTLGSFWSPPKDEQVEAALNEFGEEGWELVSAFHENSTNRVRVVLKRPLSSESRRRRSWPG